MGPVTEPERHDTPGLIGEPGPGGTAVIQDVLVTAEHPVGDPVLAQELPDVLHRIELRRPGWERHKGDVVRHDQLGRDMPAGAIQENSRMRARRNGLRDLLQMQFHALGRAAGQDQAGSFALSRTDRAEDIGRGRSLILRRCGARAAFGPAPGDLVLLSNPRLVREPNLERLAADRLCDLRQAVGELFLKAAAACSFWA
jgi:hypothetical protein